MNIYPAVGEARRATVGGEEAHCTHEAQKPNRVELLYDRAIARLGAGEGADCGARAARGMLLWHWPGGAGRRAGGRHARAGERLPEPDDLALRVLRQLVDLALLRGELLPHLSDQVQKGILHRLGLVVRDRGHGRATVGRA